MLNRIFCVCAVGALLCFSGAANAVTFTYNVTLTQQNGNTGGGTGQFVVDGATNSGTFTAPVGLISMQFTIDGHTFTLADAAGGPAEQVILNGSGALTFIAYNGILGGNILISFLGGALSYNYADQSIVPLHFSQGIISAVLAPAGANGATPIPGALPLFASGAAMLGYFGWRRKRKLQAA